VNAVDLRTGAVAWPAVVVGSRSDSIGLLHTLPNALILSVGHQSGTDSTLYVYDPAGGRQRWRLPFGSADGLAVHRSALVRVSARTGRTEAFEWATGARRWTLAAQADPPVRTLGFWSPMTEDVTVPSERSSDLTGDRFIQVTRAGKVQVRDIDTGELRRTVTSVAPDREPGTFFGYDGRLFNDEQAGAGYRIRMTELNTDQGGSTVIRSEGAGHQLNAMLPCARQRLCVLDRDGGGGTTLAAIDLTSRRELWRVAAPDGATSFSTLNGYTLVGGPDADKVVYDQDGKRVFSTQAGEATWLGRDTLLLLPAPAPESAGPDEPVSKVTIPDGRVTRLGELPPPSGECSWTAERLACPATTDLQVWSLTG
jgi:outer membrane protein assembly factor BamB